MIHENFGKGKCLKGNKPNDKVYTPLNISKLIIDKINSKYEICGTILDAFKGNGSFYNQYPNNLKKEYCEIDEGIDFFNYDKKVDWIITNPPYSILEQVLEHSFKIADNIVYLVPLSKIVSSLGRIKQINSYGGCPYIYIYWVPVCVGFHLVSLVVPFI